MIYCHVTQAIRSQAFSTRPEPSDVLVDLYADMIVDIRDRNVKRCCATRREILSDASGADDERAGDGDAVDDTVVDGIVVEESDDGTATAEENGTVAIVKEDWNDDEADGHDTNPRMRKKLERRALRLLEFQSTVRRKVLDHLVEHEPGARRRGIRGVRQDNQRLAQAISRLEAKCREREEMARRAKESKWLGEVLVQCGVQMAYGSWAWWCGEFARVA